MMQWKFKININRIKTNQFKNFKNENKSHRHQNKMVNRSGT